MRTGRFIGLVATVVMAAMAVFAREITVVRDVHGPEGPLFVDGHLYFVGWASDSLSRLDGNTVTVLNHTPGCGHNGLALTRRRTFLIACDDEQGAIIETAMDGKELRRWDSDSRGRKFTGGINDIVVTAAGGAYATLSGPFVDPPKAVMGKIFYLAPSTQQWVEVADDLNYANGIAVSPDQKTLYVNETVGNCILKFAIARDGTLENRSNFALLNLLVKNKVESWWIGPDSMKVDSTGNIYVAQLYGGKILKLSPAGKLLHVFAIAAGDGTTNVAFGPGEKELYITAVRDLKDPQAPGSIVKIPNSP